ncbi:MULTISPECIES: signal peptidase I [unclassified Microcella]|uniref:signal peptidase I n=1 Tax=unclassified Microcella TaxID=2630066 RepID=UPI0006F75497|nr:MULTISPECIES: signal peptidase I [unclassified Microcella]KQV26510.1 S26 family signal peptidase [Yonghaparkia sp. Root332]KRF32709.1 S26 family signal peptidase [Yonghaparkia sp. Soil809]
MTENAAQPTDAASPPSDATAQTVDARTSRRRGILLFLRDVVIIVGVALLISFLIKTFLIRSFYIPSDSMMNTLVRNDRIIVNQLVPEVVPIERGDVVVFRDPGGWLNPAPQPEAPPLQAALDWLGAIVGISAPDSDEHLVKRVIGLPGDRVVCCNDLGQMSVNGVPLEEPYVRLPAGSTAVSADDFQAEVPADSLWVMGDNRWDSADSRYNRDTFTEGFVPFDDVVGRAVVISWPIDRWTWLDNYPLVFDGVGDAQVPAE